MANQFDNVLILGNPNSGKSLLFNRLTGLAQKVANFPGVTVEIKEGQGLSFLFQDFPGIYSLQSMTQDEHVAVGGFRKAICDPKTRGIVYVVDATRLERSLYLLLQLKEEALSAKCPVVVAVNIIDEVISKGAEINLKGLEKALGLRVVGTSAKKGTGVKELEELLDSLPSRSELKVEAVSPTFVSSLVPFKDRAAELASSYGPKVDVILKSQHGLDRIFLSSFLGPILFLVFMIILFQSIFTWATPMMDFVEFAVSTVGTWVSAHLPEGILADFAKDALFGGVGSFVVFAPQIFMLFFVVGLLEDSGYLARAAIILHRPLSFFGLSGRSFVPLLSGHACAIPAIMAARTIESPRKRFFTWLAIPFMTCSARLPVFALLVGGFIPARTYLGGLIGSQGLAFAALYCLGIITGLVVVGVANALTKRSKNSALKDAPFVVELPPYRLPNLRPIVKQAASKMLDFVRKAGGMIFTVTVAIWVLGYFPNGAGHLDTSYLGSMGHWIQPLFAPLGLDWKVGVAVLTSFLAREVFVGTLGTLYGLDSVDGQTGALTSKLQESGVTIASAIALLVFYSLSMQCVATLSVIKRESGSNKLPIFVFVYMTVLAYGASLVAFNLAHWLF